MTVALPSKLIFMKYGLSKDDHDTGYFLELNEWCRESHIVLTHIDKPYQVVWHCPTTRRYIVYCGQSMFHCKCIFPLVWTSIHPGLRFSSYCCLLTTNLF